MRACRAQYMRDWRAANRQAYLDGLKRNYLANRDARLVAQRAYYLANRERALAYAKARREADPERAREELRAWHKNNRSKKKAHRQTRRARVLGAPINDFTLAQWRQILLDAGGRCHYCGCDFAKLTPDHKQALARGGSHTAANIVAACVACNRRKGVKPYGEFLRARA